MSVWDELVGQEHALAVLQQAAQGARAIVDHAQEAHPGADTSGSVRADASSLTQPTDDPSRSMTHAWLITWASRIRGVRLRQLLLQRPFSAPESSPDADSVRYAAPQWLGRMAMFQSSPRNPRKFVSMRFARSSCAHRPHPRRDVGGSSSLKMLTA